MPKIRPTNPETLLIQRVREGENQHEAAARHGVGRARYSRWERGLEPCPRARLGKLRAHERALLYRRRSGFTQARVAQELGRCRWWVNQMENGERPCDELIDYWEQ